MENSNHEIREKQLIFVYLGIRKQCGKFVFGHTKNAAAVSPRLTSFLR
jgi:hypothetical protein